MYTLDLKIIQFFAFLVERNDYGYCQISYEMVQNNE